jgi:hypothetical protein
MDIAAMFFARPQAERRPLTVAPCPASWEAADHPDQLRLGQFLGHAEHVLGPHLARMEGPLALMLDVALPEGVRILDQHDLDSYLFPLVSRLQAWTGRQFVSVWATKSVGEQSHITIAPATQVADPAQPMEFEVSTSASDETPTYKKQIRDQLARALTLPDGPVALELAFEVGPGRNWLNLWKPTIDSLDPLLGSTVPGRPWHPRGARIVELGLHCRVEPKRGHDVAITIVPRMLAGAGS